MKPPRQLLAAMFLLTASFSHAAMTAVRFYHLGEGDAGVGHAVTATNSLDSVSTNALTLAGAPKYWAYAAPGNTNSTFSLLFSTTNQGTAAVVSETNNVCLEAWANTGWRSTHVIAYNGNPALDGFGLVLETNTYKAVLGGVGTVGTVSCPPGEWMHLALVCSNGTANFFTNGVLAATANATPNPPTDNLTIGGPNTGTNDVQGFVDEVRISTFATGEFKAADLLYAPPLGNLAITRDAANNVVVSVPAIYSSVTLQEATDLPTTNWQALASPSVVEDQQVWTNSIQGTARFYRLTKTVGGQPVPMMTMVQGSIPRPLTTNNVSDVQEFDGLYGYTQSWGVDGSNPAIFDASASLDPLSNTTNTLSFHWEIWHSVLYGGTRYTAYGITGYHAPILQFVPQTMPSQPAVAGDPDARYWHVRLTLQHLPFTPGVVPPQETVLWFRFRYPNTSSTSQQWDTCQSCPPPPASCPSCPVEALRATAEEP